MAIIRLSKLREMSNEELDKKTNEINLEMAKETGKIDVGGVAENPGNIKQLKKTIARILTIKNERIRRG